MAALSSGNIDPGKRGVKLVIDYRAASSDGMGTPRSALVDTETGETICNVKSILYKIEQGVAYVELCIRHIEVVSDDKTQSHEP